MFLGCKCRTKCSHLTWEWCESNIHIKIFFYGTKNSPVSKSSPLNYYFYTKLFSIGNSHNLREHIFNNRTAQTCHNIIRVLAISLFIISNTIKLTVYSRRLEISIMKSVGATNSFVRLPFVVEGMILGIVSGAVSLGLVWGLYELAVRQFGGLLRSLSLSALPFAPYALQMLGIFVAIGIISGVGGSMITMRKYLNKEGSEISAV